MGYDPIEVAQAASQAESEVLSKLRKSGVIGHTETKVVQLVGETECYLGDDGHYEIPIEVSALDQNCKYNLYVDGCKFVGDFSEHDSGWAKTDPADTRFNSLFWKIYPDQINPVPEMVVITLEEVIETVHTVENKYLYKEIDLDTYGISAEIFYLFFSSSGGKSTIDDVGNFWSAVSTGGEVLTRMSYSDSHILNTGITRVINPEIGCVQVGFSVVLNYDNVYVININITKVNGNGADITVKVT